MIGKHLVAVLLLCALGGCVNLGQSAPTRYYVLNATAADPTAARTTPANNPAIELERVGLPEYLNQANIVTRSRANEVQRAEFDLWAGPLNDEITRTLGENLSLALPTDRVYVGGPRRDIPVDFVVSVDILTFERDASDSVWLIARWSVLRDDGRNVAVTRRSVFRQAAAGGDYALSVAAMSKALGELSVEIAEAIRRSGPPRRS